MAEWEALNENLRKRRGEEPEDATFQERARMRIDALVEGFWNQVGANDPESLQTKVRRWHEEQEEKANA